MSVSIRRRELSEGHERLDFHAVVPLRDDLAFAPSVDREPGDIQVVSGSGRPCDLARVSRTKGLPEDRPVAFDDEVIDEHLHVAQSMPRVRKLRI